MRDADSLIPVEVKAKDGATGKNILRDNIPRKKQPAQWWSRQESDKSSYRECERERLENPEILDR